MPKLPLRLVWLVMPLVACSESPEAPPDPSEIGGTGGHNDGGTLGHHVEPLSPHLSGQVGTWCGPRETAGRWMVLEHGDPAETCGHYADALLGAHGHAPSWAVELPYDTLPMTGSSERFGAERCTMAGCESLEVELDFEHVDNERLSGRWRVPTATSGSLHAEGGRFRADHCDWDDVLPPHPLAPPPITGLALRELALYQAVKVPLMRHMAPAGERVASVVAGRRGWLRVFVAPEPGWEPRPVRVRVQLAQPSGTTQTFEVTRTIQSESTEGAWNSTINFELPPGSLRTGTRFSVGLYEAGACPEIGSGGDATRYPATGTTPLPTRDTGTLKLTLVPIRYDHDGSGRVPDVSTAAVAAYRKVFEQLYPVGELELTVRSPGAWNHRVAADSTGWGTLLSAVANLRQSDGVADDVIYYGLVNPADTPAQYCTPSCVAGIAYQAQANSPALRVGLGIGYVNAAGGAIEADSATFAAAHEVGHALGRGHAPCRANDGVDADYPYTDGLIGSWGFDSHTQTLLNPVHHADLMSYCRPQWISDFTYQALLERLEFIHSSALVLSSELRPSSWRTLVVEASGRASWGAKLRMASTAGLPADWLSLLNDEGLASADFEAYRIDLSEDLGAMWLLPETAQVASAWRAVVLPDGRTLPIADSSPTAAQLEP